MFDALSQWIDATFSPPLRLLFAPFNSLMTQVPEPVWKLSALALFASAVVWVFCLKESYVNRGAPARGFLYDLRLWTIVALLPFVVIYLYF